MIIITGSVHRSFNFPASVPEAFEFYAQIGRTLSYLMHISIVRSYAEDQYRAMFSTVELGIYRVRIICDIQSEPDRRNWILRIHPLDTNQPLRNEAGLYSLTGQGYFTSESIFSQTGNQTQIEYKLKLRARLPIPMGLRFMPNSVINGIASGITQWRIQETVDAFIDRSIRAYQ